MWKNKTKLILRLEQQSTDISICYRLDTMSFGIQYELIVDKTNDK